MSTGNRFAGLTAAMGPLAKAAEQGELSEALTAPPVVATAPLSPSPPPVPPQSSRDLVAPALAPPIQETRRPPRASAIQRNISIHMPDNMSIALQTRAVSERTSVRSLILAAVAEKYGIDLDSSELKDKRRRDPAT